VRYAELAAAEAKKKVTSSTGLLAAESTPLANSNPVIASITPDIA